MRTKMFFASLSAWFFSLLFGGILIILLQSYGLLSVDYLLQNLKADIRFYYSSAFCVLAGSIICWSMGKRAFEENYFAGWPLIDLITSWLLTVMLGANLVIITQILYGTDYWIYSLKEGTLVIPLMFNLVFIMVATTQYGLYREDLPKKSVFKKINTTQKVSSQNDTFLYLQSLKR